MTPVRLEPAAPRSRDKHSTTEPLRSLSFIRDVLLDELLSNGVHALFECTCTCIHVRKKDDRLSSFHEGNGFTWSRKEIGKTNTLNRSYKWPPTYFCARSESKHRSYKISIPQNNSRLFRDSEKYAISK